MKKGILILLLFVSTTMIYGQRGRVVSALSYKESGDLKNAYLTIDKATDPKNDEAKTSINWSNSWQVRGGILQDIYRNRIPDIVENALFKAFDAYKRAIELDVDNRYAKSIVSDLIFLQTDFSNFAVTEYQSEHFDKAMQGFECFIEISNLPLMSGKREGVFDTSIIYNAALAAYKAENWEKAITYFDQSIKNDYNGAVSVNYIYNAYQAKGDTLNSISILKKGFEKYPDDETMLAQLIKIYITIENNEETIEYLNIAIAKDPSNVSLYMIKGRILEKMGDKETAIGNYKLAIKIDSTQFTPYYNIGVIYFNKGVNAFNEAKKISNGTKEYDDKIGIGIDNFKEALPIFEKAYVIDSKQMAVLGSLRMIYYRLQMVDKYKKINEEIKNRRR